MFHLWSVAVTGILMSSGGLLSEAAHLFLQRRRGSHRKPIFRTPVCHPNFVSSSQRSLEPGVGWGCYPGAHLLSLASGHFPPLRTPNHTYSYWSLSFSLCTYVNLHSSRSLSAEQIHNKKSAQSKTVFILFTSNLFKLDKQHWQKKVHWFNYANSVEYSHI